MYNASEGFKKAQLSPVGEIFVRLELMDKNHNFIDEITYQVDADSFGDISVDKNRDIRRMFTLSLDNHDGRFTWGPDSLIWIDGKLVKVYIGLLVGSEIEYVPQGVFVVSMPEAESTPTARLAHISGHDKAYLLTGNLGRFDKILTVEKGTNIHNAIRILAESGGITHMILDECDVEVPYDLTYQIMQNRWDAMKELAELAVYDLYFDVDGYLRFQPKADPQLVAPSWTYKIDSQTLYAGSIRKLEDTELYNHILVFGGSGQTAEFSYEIVVDENDPRFAGNPLSIQRIGRRIWAWNDGNPDPIIDTQSQAEARAKYELKKRLSYSESVEIQLAPNYLHDAGDVIELIDEHNGSIGKYEIQSFSVPIAPKLVTMQALKIVDGFYSW